MKKRQRKILHRLIIFLLIILIFLLSLVILLNIKSKEEEEPVVLECPIVAQETVEISSFSSIKGYKEENEDLYQKYSSFDQETVVYLVNENIINDDNYDLLKSLYEDEYFIKERTSRYLTCEKEDIRSIVEYVNANADLVPYEDVEAADTSQGLAVNVNKHYYLGENYEPEDLVLIDAVYGFQGYLRQEAYEAYKQMYEAAVAQGLSLRIVSAYRSYNRQVNLYNSYASSDGVALADTYSARAGFSDHQTGLTVDILSPSTDFSNFEYSAEGKWLAENAHKYGFIMRYPEGKQEVTGYKYESWHFRYLGVELASEVYASGLTYDEYYAYYRESRG